MVYKKAKQKIESKSYKSKERDIIMSLKLLICDITMTKFVFNSNC